MIVNKLFWKSGFFMNPRFVNEHAINSWTLSYKFLLMMFITIGLGVRLEVRVFSLFAWFQSMLLGTHSYLAHLGFFC